MHMDKFYFAKEFLKCYKREIPNSDSCIRTNHQYHTTRAQKKPITSEFSTAIIKVSENGMVTIRSPALQQAINAGMTPSPKPDFIVKADVPNGTSSKSSPAQQAQSQKRPNGFVQQSLADFHSRLSPDAMPTGLSGLANIQISKVANGHPIPENGINLRGTSVTLTKVKSDMSMSEMQQAKCAVREAISATMGKGKKKKKRGNGARSCGDDWNLVGEILQ